VIGALIGGWHVCWSLLVLLGWAQRIIDFIFWAHMVRPIYVIKPFDPAAGITLVAVTAIIGYTFRLRRRDHLEQTAPACNCASISLAARPGQTA
jgi:hypothetical protein